METNDKFGSLVSESFFSFNFDSRIREFFVHKKEFLNIML